MDKGIGQRVRRKEDWRLLTGEGCFSDDFGLDGQAYAQVLRSPHAHARIKSIDKSAAEAAPGVLAVLTGDDLLADGLAAIPHNPRPTSPPDPLLANRDGSDMFVGLHYALPADKARFVGEGVAFIVAESLQAARDGAELVDVEYEILPAVTDTRAAAEPGAPLIYEEIASNVCLDADVGDPAATEAAFAGAEHCVSMEMHMPRVTGVPMEPRAAIGDFAATTGRTTLFAGSGNVIRQKRELAEIFGVEEDRVRVVARDVGGNFGTRNAIFPEFILVSWAARRLGRPVKWTCERSEAFASDYQGRDLVCHLELAMDEGGRFQALRASNISNIGSHSVSLVPLAKGIGIISGTYHIPVAHVRARAVFSNTPPTNPYRSAGRPEIIFALERLVEKAARETGLDPVEIRRRNMIDPAAMPYRNPTGMRYDSGNFAENLDKVMALADWQGFAARRADSEAKGLRRGLGLASYIETSTGFPRERTDMTVRPEGVVDVVIGTLSSGQGHETSFAQVVAERLGAPFEAVNLISGDTDIVKIGGGTHSGRSMRMAGIVMVKAAAEIVDKGRRIAAHLFEAAESDLEYTEGRFRVAGTDRALGLFEVAGAAETRADLPADLQGPLAATADETVRIPAFPNGCHVCEVEVDADTGAVDLLSYAAIDDVGRAINPMIVDAQTHGGIVQGLGEAMSEECVWDPDTGQLLSGSFLDYAMPRADDVPAFAVEINEVPMEANELGVKAGGEGGTTPALAVYINAVVNALEDLGVRHIEMPATPERVWRAIQKARAG